MKTKKVPYAAVRTAVLVVILLVAALNAGAQTREGKSTPKDLRDCMARLESIMLNTEEALRYCAKSEETEACCAAVKRLEIMADLAEAHLKYTAPRTESEVLPDEQAPDPDQERWLANQPVTRQPD